MNCSTDRYAELYAPWLSGSADFAERFIKPSDRVMDLCGGTGLVAQAAIDMGCPEVTLLDVNPRVEPHIDQWGTMTTDPMGILTGDANHLVWYLDEGHCLDVIVCRQAIAYLNLNEVAKSAAQALAQGGRFCFNNFRNPHWFTKRYKFAEDLYIERGWYIGRHVFHIQHKVRVGWDLTKFKWHTHDEIVDAMGKYFSLEINRTEKTNYYTCTVQR